LNGEISILELILHASVVVQVVMAILVAASVYSWTIIFRKWREFREVAAANDEFEQLFWSGADLERLYRDLRTDTYMAGSLEGVFIAGYREFRHLYEERAVPVETAIGSAQRGMRAAVGRELDTLEDQLSWLAIIGSASPYIGLFGTVWGIMAAFQGLSAKGQATIAMVAPGIAEALVATAIGLFAAIPAVIGYNRMANFVAGCTSRYEAFAEDFLSILQRQGQQRRSGDGVRAAAGGA
jgi:biopolymer transport protein TolQ